MNRAPFLSLGLVAALVAPSVRAEEPAVTPPSRESSFAPGAQESLYFLKKCGDVMFFTTREFQPGSSWRPVPTSLYAVDWKSGQMLRKMHTDYAIEQTIQPQGKLAAIQERSGFRLYDLETGQVKKDFGEVDGGPHHDVEWSPDGKKFLFDGEYPTILRMYDVEKDEIVTLRENRFAQLHSEVWGTDSKTIALLEDRNNPLLGIRTVKFLDADPASEKFKEIVREIHVERAHIKDIHRITWSPEYLIGWMRTQGPGDYHEVVIQMPEGVTVGTGRARDVSAVDDDEPWTYTRVGSNKTGTFRQVFGKDHPVRNDPLPLVPGQAREHWSSQYRKLGDHALWSGHRAGFKYRLCDRLGNVKVQLTDEYFGYAEVKDGVLRVFGSEGILREYDL